MKAPSCTRSAAFFLIAGGLAVGCGFPRAPAHPEDDDGFTAVEQEPPPGVADDPAVAASLYPGDVVSLRLSSAETTDVPGLAVDERGFLHVPLAGDVEVSGLPLVEAEQRIEQAMQRFDRSVRVTIILSDPAGHLASVIGAVGNQGRHAVVAGMRVADLLAAAGGAARTDEGGIVASLADLGNARLMRDGAALPISVELALAGDTRHNVRVRPGDYLYVPPQLAGLISVLGEVNGARVFAHRPGIRLSQALAIAGGISRDANGGDIRIVRGLSTAPRIYNAAINHVVAGTAPDPVLAPGDIVYVGSSALADFRDFMSAIAPVISIAATTAVGIAVGVR